MQRIPKYRKHSTGNQGMGQWKKKRQLFNGKFNSPESRREYETWLQEVVLRDSPDRQVPRDGSATVARCMLLFLNHACDYYGAQRPSEYYNFIPVAQDFAELHGSVPIGQIEPKHLKGFAEHLAKTPGRRGFTKDGQAKPWQRSRGYCNACLRRTRQMLKWLSEEGYCPASVYHGSLAVTGLKAGKTTAKETEQRTPVDMLDLARTLRRLSPTLQAMVRVQWLTGCRPGQVCAMRNDEIAKGSDGLWVWTPKRHKSAAKGKTLTIFLGPRCQEILGPFLSDREYVFTPTGNSAGAYYKASSYHHAVKKAAAKVGVKPWTPHQVRHARGTEVEDRYDVLAASATLGHAKLDTTKLYTSQAHARAKLVAREIG